MIDQWIYEILACSWAYFYSPDIAVNIPHMAPQKRIDPILNLGVYGGCLVLGGRDSLALTTMPQWVNKPTNNLRNYTW